MNKELIIKLAKLANNNPNENEANAAARKVCRLLAEANFNFGIIIERTKEPEFKRTYPGTWNDPIDIVNNFFHRKQKSEVKDFWWYDPTTDRYIHTGTGEIKSRLDYEFIYGTKREQADPRIKKCIHCRKVMTTAAEIANKICVECWRKEREKFGL